MVLIGEESALPKRYKVFYHSPQHPELTTIQIIDHTATLNAAGEKVTKISFTGYSLGGVIARYVLGILHQRRFFDTVQPVNYTSIATPHLGLPKYDTFFGKLSRTLGPKLLSRTGTQFFATDAWGPRSRPLVEVMADTSRCS